MLGNLIEKLLGWCALFAIIWVVFAYFDVFSKSDTLTVYQIRETGDRTSGSGYLLPAKITNAVETYRIIGKNVTLRYQSGEVTKFENCTIFDVKNWRCTFSDNSATFGAKSGVYYNINNTQKFPHLKGYPEDETVSRWQYILTECEWDIAGGKFFGYIDCALRPFFT